METQSPNLAPARVDKRIHVCLPIRVTYWGTDSKPRLEMACTYDISSHGARLTGLRCVKQTGEILAIERGKNKALCRVAWIGDPNSNLRGQVGVQCVEEGKLLWETELRDLEEVYDLITQDATVSRINPAKSSPGALGSNRRRYERFPVEGTAELVGTGANGKYLEGNIKNICEMGCLVTPKGLVNPGTEFKVILCVSNYDLTLKGAVRHAEKEVGLGIEFREIRKGDRPLLQYLLQKLATAQQAVVAAAATPAIATL
jgi:PilZ domain-containing protein